MRDHELELIAALVEGRLEDETAARALVESAPEYREEYEAQKLAYETLQGVGPAVLSDSERAGLRRDVWAEMRAAPATGTRTPWYYRWAPIAAGLFVVVGVTAVLSQGGTDSAESARLGADLAAAETTTTAAASEPLDEADGGAAPAEGGEQTATTTAATQGAADEESGSGYATAIYSEEAARVREGDVSGNALESYEADQTSTGEVAECLARLDLADFQVVATLPRPPGQTTATTTSGVRERLLVAVADDVDSAIMPVAFISIEQCELVFLDE